ncbi:MAG: InlB B-repeat-containing protein [Lachnospiraceae bacterium]|nr:InlB B-repeat-containing protein [Lachnospiraceae bacterium]
MKKFKLLSFIVFICIIVLFPQIKVFAADNQETDFITITYIYLKETKTVTIHPGESLDLWIPEPANGTSLAYWITNPGVPIPERNIVTSDTVFYEDTTLYAVLNDPVVVLPPEEEHPVLDPDSIKNLYPPVEEPTTYSVTLNGCNDSYLWTMLIDKNTAIESFPSDPQKKGYIFIGWFTEENGGIEITEQTIVTSDMTLYAHWEKIEDGYYTIIFDKNYDTNDPIHCIWVTTQIDADQNLPRKGYIFKGWYTKKSGGKKIKNGMALASDMTVYAHWEKVKVKKTSIKQLSVNGNKLTIQYKKIPSVKGYQIQISTSRKFTKKTTRNKTLKNKKTATGTFDRLKSNKTYYVRIRAYKTDSTKAKVYGKWSGIKKVKVN